MGPEEYWQNQPDQKVSEALRRPDDYSAEGRSIILAEASRRGLRTDLEVASGDVEPVFSPIRVDKFVILCLATLSLYLVAWSYRNWRSIRTADHSNILPAVRAGLYPFFLLALLKRIGLRNAGGLTLAFWVLFLVAYLLGLGGISVLAAMLSFLPLLPAVRAVNALHGAAAATQPSYGWRLRSFAIPAVIWALFLVGWLSDDAAVPRPVLGSPTSVIAGADLPESDLRYLLDSGALDDEETIIYFYSMGSFSVEDDGVFISDWGVTNYWTDPITEEIRMGYLGFEEIENIEVKWSEGPSEYTVVRLSGSDEDWILFYLSPKDGGDHLFMEELEARSGGESEARPRGFAT